MMKRLSIVLMLLGLTLVSVGVVSSQEPNNPPPPQQGGRPRDGDGQPPRDGRPGGRRDGDRDGNRGDNDNPNDGTGDSSGGEVATDGSPARAEGDAELVTVSDTTEETNSPATIADVTRSGIRFNPNPYLGGQNTVFDASEEAFTNHIPSYTEEQIALFEEGDELFEQSFIAAIDPNSGLQEDGLGPFFNADSCESCHVEDGRGRPPAFAGEPESGFLIRLARPELSLNGSTHPDPTYGGQLQDMAIDGLAPEGQFTITYVEVNSTFADGTPYTLQQPIYTVTNLPYGELASDVTFSPRVANQMIGLGYLDALTEETILSFADPSDANGDGISGRPNYVWDAQTQNLAIGRFGWKANQPNLIQQTAGAYNGDMGISSSLFSGQPCMEAQADCMVMPYGGSPEISDEHVLAVVFYSSSLAVPAQRDSDTPLVQQGESLFMEAQCSSCHVPNMTTGIHRSIPQLSNQDIRPFTDLLLHDMGDGLADGQTDFQATGSEWRTPPLWGIGLFETVNGHTYYLHDGRARDLNEAILWHGGEAEASRNAYLEMSQAEREALIAFLKSL